MGKYIKLYTEQPDSNLELPHVGYYLKVFYLPNIVPIEYLLSSGTQYILLSLPVLKTDYLEAVFEATGIYTQTTNDTIFDTYPHAQFWMDAYSYNSTTNSITFASNVGGNATNGGILIPTDRKKKCILSTLGRTKDDEFTELIRPLTKDISDFRLFGNYYNLSTSYPIKFHNFRIKKNDTIMYDLIPVRVGTTGYMFDKISRLLFGNNGTGNFILGSDIVSDKPYDSEIEYLESTGSLFINTGYIPKGNDIKIKGKFYLKNYTANYGNWFGAYTDENTNSYRIVRQNSTNTGIFYTCGTKAGSGGTTTIAGLNNLYDYELSYNQVIINENVYTSSGVAGSENTKELILWANNEYAGKNSIGRHYYFQIYKNNELVLDLIPVRKKNIGYMYDKISKLLFSNAGSGNFILGPDV